MSNSQQNLSRPDIIDARARYRAAARRLRNIALGSFETTVTTVPGDNLPQHFRQRVKSGIYAFSGLHIQRVLALFSHPIDIWRQHNICLA